MADVPATSMAARLRRAADDEEFALRVERCADAFSYISHQSCNFIIFFCCLLIESG
jgi:hypothetical protein